MAQRLSAGSIRVQRFGLAFDPTQRRLDFPHAEIDELEHQSGRIRYTATDLHFEGLRAQLDRGQWQATAASAGKFALRDENGRFELDVGRIEFPRGLLATRAVGTGVELLTPHASLNDVTLRIRGPFRRAAPPVPAAASNAETQPMATISPPPAPPPPEAPRPLRQERLRFLDGVTGEIKLTLQVKLDLPVVGSRTLDQGLRIPIKDGGLDFRALEKGLDWLEGTFLDIGLDGNRLAVSYGVPIVLPSREIISWALDEDALTLARFDRVPLRSLFDIRLPKKRADNSKDKDKDKRASRLESFSVEKIEIKLSLLAPRSLEVGGGAILFGGDDAPGMVDLSIAGSVRAPGAGALKGSIGLLDTTIKDLHLGGAAMTVDRLHLGAIDQLEVVFDGFMPTEITARIDRVTATNLALVLGGPPRVRGERT